MTPIPDITTPPAPAPRVDLYGPVHQALCQAMAQTLRDLGTRDVRDAEARGAVLDSVDSLIGLLRSHLAHESDFIHTAIEARQPGGTRQAADDHLRHLEAIGHLADESRAVRGAQDEHRPLLAQRLHRHLAAFVSEKLLHMHAEEARGHAALWALYSDDELLALQGRMAAALS